MNYVITGHTSGIGKALSLKFANEGWIVAASARRENLLKEVNEINENSNIQIITENKSNQEIAEILEELMQDHRDQSNLKKIESLEEKLINNLDENSYSELIKLKSQLNRD